MSLPARPTVTFIMAAYNVEKTIGAALTSVFTQDYAGADVVVVDDGSKDGTAAVVQGYVDAGLPVTLVRKENGGCAAARNTALEHATGELIGILDADDELLPGYLDAAVGTYLENGGGRRFVALNAYLLTPGGMDPKRQVLYLPTPPAGKEVRAILESNFGSIFTVFPRAMVDEVGVFREDLITCEDWDLWARSIISGYQIHVIREPHALYRWTAGSMSSSGENMWRGEEDLLEGLRENYRDRLSAADAAYLDERIATGSIMRLRMQADAALRDGDVATARERYAQVARLAPSDRRSVLKSKTLGSKPGDVFWRRRLLAADAATGRDKAGR